MGAWTGSYASIDGLILDGREDDGTKWGIETLSGWGSTSPTLELEQRIRNSGALGGDSFGGPRSVSLAGWVTVPASGMLSLAEDRLIKATSRQPRQLQIIEDNRMRWTMVQRSGEVLFTAVTPRYAKWSIQVDSKDWRRFSTELTGSTLLPATTGGLLVPLTVPFTIAASVVSGQINLNNPGNEIGPVRLRIDGPATGPVVTHVGSGQALVFSSSLVIAAGEWLDVDMEDHTVLANGQASRSGFITSRGWSAFEPGPNTWSFTAAAYNEASQLTVHATPAYE
jgi:hypothetical protein